MRKLGPYASSKETHAVAEMLVRLGSKVEIEEMSEPKQRLIGDRYKGFVYVVTA